MEYLDTGLQERPGMVNGGRLLAPAAPSHRCECGRLDNLGRLDAAPQEWTCSYITADVV